MVEHHRFSGGMERLNSGGCRPVRFNITIHNHQPEGNFGWVFEEAYDRAYAPFLDALENHPGIKINLHTSGPLLNWLEEHRPEYLDRVSELIGKGRIEPVGGGFYEPILSILHPRDVVGQIRRMTDYIEDRFGVSPRGFWPAERVWDPSLPWFVRETGMEYTLLDDNHFLTSLAGELPLMGRYRTEFKGATLNVFPIDHRLRYLIPFREVEEFGDYLEGLSREGRTGMLVYGDDGEKFGSWPETSDWVYGKGWLERFFNFLEERRDLVELTLLGDYLDDSPVEDLVSLPATSYREMTEWTLPAKMQLDYKEFEHWLEKQGKLEASQPFIKGGFWNNFFTRYPESYRMHRMQLFASELVEHAAEGEARSEAREALWAGQCNCPYWHGVFGGLYLNSLRFANYRNMIKAVRLSLPVDAQKEPRCLETGFHGLDGPALVDGRVMLLFTEDGWYVHSLFYFPTDFNLFDVIARRPEAYHSRVLQREEDGKGAEHTSIHDRLEFKEEGLEGLLKYDRLPRLGFTDIYSSPGCTVESLVDVIWENRMLSAKRAVCSCESDSVVSCRDVVIRDGSGVNALRVEKTVSLPDGHSAEVECRFSLQAERELSEPLLVILEFNVTLLAGDDPDRLLIAGGKSHRLKETVEFTGKALSMEDRWQKVRFGLVAGLDERFYHYPVHTVSLSEEGVEKNYQGSAIGIKFELPQGVRESVRTLTLKIDRITD